MPAHSSLFIPTDIELSYRLLLSLHSIIGVSIYPSLINSWIRASINDATRLPITDDVGKAGVGAKQKKLLPCPDNFFHPMKSFFRIFVFNRSSRRKRDMASNPLFILPDFFCIFNELCYDYIRFEGNGKIVRMKETQSMDKFR